MVLQLGQNEWGYQTIQKIKTNNEKNIFSQWQAAGRDFPGINQVFCYIYNNFPFDKKLGNVTSTTLYNYLCLNESKLPKKGISIFIMSKVKIIKKIQNYW